MRFMKSCFLISFALFIIGCSTPRQATVATSPNQLLIDGKLWSSIFQQRAAEYKALCIQAYNMAKERVNRVMMEKGRFKALPGTLAIITDIDETFLDNSPAAVHQALVGKDYEDAAWHEWTSKGMADTLPGALGFFNYAAGMNIEIFYITNRDEKDKAGTMANLQRFGFPFADSGHLIVRGATSSKEDRRRQVAVSREIILLLGDNLADFSALFDKKSEAERDANVQKMAAEFGKRFIILPNFNYGGWEDAIYDNRRDWTPAQKDSLLKSRLKSY
jgi:5'-nucleotidase (lipoprotein e(P4) family)